MAVALKRLSLGILIGLFLLFALGAAGTVSAQAEDETTPTNSQEDDGPPISNGHEIDDFSGNEDDLDGQTIAEDDTDGGVSLAFILFILGSITALVFIVLFIYKLLPRKS